MMRITVHELSQPDIRPHGESGDDRYILNEDFKFVLCIDGANRSFTIPKGLTYDGASVPRFAMALIGFERDGIHRAGALVHDFMYRRNGVIWDKRLTPFHYTRKDADRVFLKCIEHHGIKSWHGRLAYLAVRGFGWMKQRF